MTRVALAGDDEFNNKSQEQVRRVDHLCHVYKLLHKLRLVPQGLHATNGFFFLNADMKGVDTKIHLIGML